MPHELKSPSLDKQNHTKVNIGPNTTKRARLRLIEHRDPYGNRPTGLSGTFPVKSGEAILSGMLMSVVRNTVTGRNEWVKGYSGSSQGLELAFAVDDATDPDVVAAGNLRGLSARGRHDISIPYTKAGETYQYGDELTYDGVTGHLKKVTGVGELVVAVVSKDYDSPVDHQTTFVPADATATVSAGVQGGQYLLGHHTNATDVRLVRLVTVEPYLSAA